MRFCRKQTNPNQHIKRCVICGARFDRRYGHECEKPTIISGRFWL
jgi:hypothetical protein